MDVQDAMVLVRYLASACKKHKVTLENIDEPTGHSPFYLRGYFGVDIGRAINNAGGMAGVW